MKIGDYVRSDRGIIAKITNINKTGSIICDRNIYFGFNVVFKGKRVLCDLSKIIKSSPNIIDLIEVGDYVDGYKVIDIAQAPKKAIYIESIGQGALIPITNIYSIVTKEQFESMEYKVKE